MKFTIEVDDFWLEEEELTEALATHIKSAVVHKISDDIKDEVDRKITEAVTAMIKEKAARVIDDAISDAIDVGTITVGKETISITEHVKKLFNNHHSWSSPDAKLKKIAQEFGDECKLQYNNAFANKIVSNMKEQGLLKDEVVQILLEGK